MAALQLFKGEHEPFLGMGSADGSVDVWLWNAAAQADREQYADVDTAYTHMVVDQYPFEQEAANRSRRASDAGPRTVILNVLARVLAAWIPAECRRLDISAVLMPVRPGLIEGPEEQSGCAACPLHL